MFYVCAPLNKPCQSSFAALQWSERRVDKEGKMKKSLGNKRTPQFAKNKICIGQIYESANRIERVELTSVVGVARRGRSWRGFSRIGGGFSTLIMIIFFALEAAAVTAAENYSPRKSVSQILLQLLNFLRVPEGQSLEDFDPVARGEHLRIEEVHPLYDPLDPRLDGAEGHVRGPARRVRRGQGRPRRMRAGGAPESGFCARRRKGENLRLRRFLLPSLIIIIVPVAHFGVWRRKLTLQQH